MIVQEINFYTFWDELCADPYSDYSYEAARFIFNTLEEWAKEARGYWVLDIPSIRGSFTEIPADEWREEILTEYRADNWAKISGGYIIEH